MSLWDVPEAEAPFRMVEHKLTADELHREWEKLMEKEYVRLKEAHQRVAALEEEMEVMEKKWAVKVEDAVEEIGLLKTCLE